jgi:hypothetical protein
MAWIINRYMAYLSRYRVWRHRTSWKDSPPLAVALFACLVCSVFIWWAAGPVLSLLDIWSDELLVSALIPILITFIILYRSYWHPKITGAPRTSLLFLLSGIIFCFSLFVIGFLLVVGCVFKLGMNADLSPQ